MNPTAAPPKDYSPPPDYNALIHFLRHKVQPPSSRYVTRDDVLELVVWAPITDTTVNLSMRFQAPDGQVLPRFESIVATANGAAATIKLLQNAEGFLTSASIETPGAPRGQAFVALRIRRGGGTSDITQGEYVMAGYPGAIAGLSFPGSRIVSPMDGRGRMRSFAVTNPAAGADWSVTVPAGVQWIIRSITATLTTAIAVANRQVSLQISDATPRVVLVSGENVSQVASLADVYSWFSGAFSTTGVAPLQAGLPSEYRLLPGWKFGTVTAAIAGADQWSAIAVAVEEFVGG